MNNGTFIMYGSRNCEYCKLQLKALEATGVDFEYRLAEDFPKLGLSILPTTFYFAADTTDIADIMIEGLATAAELISSIKDFEETSASLGCSSK